ncbi:MAG: hypothetical protein AB8E15_05685 [Bdellovibrionales bacterium]
MKSLEILKLTESFKSEIIDQIRFAPTGDNSQHFKYSWSTNSLFVYYIEELGEHTLNEDNKASMLSLGAVLAIVRMISSTHNLGLDFKLNENKKNNEPIAEIEFYPSKGEGYFSELIPIIKRRTTNRNHHIKNGEIDKLLEETLSHTSSLIEVKWVTSPSISLKQYLIKCETYVYQNYSAFSDTEQWIRYNKKQWLESKNGFNLKNIKVNMLDAIFIKFIVKSRRRLNFFWKTAMGPKIKLDAKRQIENTSAIVAFTCSLKNDKALIETGQIAFIQWLRLSAAGLQVQPLTIASLTAHTFLNKGSVKGCPKQFKEVFKSSKDLLRDEFKLKENQSVLWMFRTGKGNVLPDDSKTLRLDPLDYLV